MILIGLKILFWVTNDKTYYTQMKIKYNQSLSSSSIEKDCERDFMNHFFIKTNAVNLWYNKGINYLNTMS